MPAGPKSCWAWQWQRRWAWIQLHFMMKQHWKLLKCPFDQGYSIWVTITECLQEKTTNILWYEDIVFVYLWLCFKILIKATVMSVTAVCNNPWHHTGDQTSQKQQHQLNRASSSWSVLQVGPCGTTTTDMQTLWWIARVKIRRVHICFVSRSMHISVLLILATVLQNPVTFIKAYIWKTGLITKGSLLYHLRSFNHHDLIL